MYRRLPPGPQRLPRAEIVRHQRLRLHGAMIEAVSRDGYDGTTVRHVIGLAGVSRRCFYEQFDSKEDCFLSTFDLLAGRGVRRMRDAYVAAHGDIEDRLGAAFREFALLAHTRHKAASLVLVEAERAGARGPLRLRHATAVCERLLVRSFSESPGARALPRPLVRAIAGGLQAVMSGWLRDSADPRRGDPAAAMLRWTLEFNSPAAERISARMAKRVAGRLRAAPAGIRGPAYARTRGTDTRERLLENALKLAVVDDYRSLTAAQIAETANVSMDAFFELYADKDECFLAALDLLAGELLGIASSPDLRSPGWPLAVRRVMGELMCFLAEHPLYARTIAHEAFTAGPASAQRALELGYAVAALLTGSATPSSRDSLVVQGLAGAMLHTIRCQVACSGIQLLPALADYLTLVALAPSIGAEAAMAVLGEDSAS